jgi:phage-related protein
LHREAPESSRERSGGPGEIRTPYLVNANDALYQVSYRPEVRKENNVLDFFLAERGTVSAFSIQARYA